MEDELDRRIGERLKSERSSQGLSLDELAARSGVSRGMISKIERGEASPTAVLLGRIAAGLGVGLSSFFGNEPTGDPVARRADQPVWRDPQTRYLRRNLTPPGRKAAVELIEVVLPPQARVAFEAPWTRRVEQQVWVIEGVLEKTVGAESHRLETGDCLHMTLDEANSYFNPGPDPARYLVALHVTGR